ncbi:hypothetical protein J6590_028328 [Homalodisca vitripennis]|nr:hypothetical protein J6590_028328 [Homalodisca vitripennis]
MDLIFTSNHDLQVVGADEVLVNEDKHHIALSFTFVATVSTSYDGPKDFIDYHSCNVGLFRKELTHLNYPVFQELLDAEVSFSLLHKLTLSPTENLKLQEETARLGYQFQDVPIGTLEEVNDFKPLSIRRRSDEWIYRLHISTDFYRLFHPQRNNIQGRIRQRSLVEKHRLTLTSSRNIHYNLNHTVSLGSMFQCKQCWVVPLTGHTDSFFSGLRSVSDSRYSYLFVARFIV